MKFPVVVLSDGVQRVTFRNRIDDKDELDVKLSPESVLVTPGFVLRQVASILYGTSEEWYKIAESSNLRYPTDWVVGDKIKVQKTKKSVLPGEGLVETIVREY